jgi:hypothetical protein
MNHGVLTNVPKESIAKAIWKGQATMGTDGSMRDPLATYSFLISLSQIEVVTCAKGGGFLPTTAKYLDPYSQQMEAAALLAGLCWIKALLNCFPNHTHNNPPSLPIPIDNKAVVTDVNRKINLQTPTFDLLSPTTTSSRQSKRRYEWCSLSKSKSSILKPTKTTPRDGRNSMPTPK